MKQAAPRHYEVIFKKASSDLNGVDLFAVDEGP